MTRRIIVLRHGETEDNAAGIWQGHRDSHLSSTGRAQAAAAAAALMAYRPSVIVSSDLSRAYDTARAVAELCDLPIRKDPRLREGNVGEWSGLTRAEIRERFPQELAAFEAGDDIHRGTTGERESEVMVRAGAAMAQVCDELAPGETAVVVCHGVSARDAVGAMLGWPLDAVRKVRSMDNCHWAELSESKPVGEAAPEWMLGAWNRGAPGVTAPGFGTERVFG